MSDELLRRCQHGDEAALALLVAEYQERIFRLACRVTGDAALAEEATAQALLKIWTRARQWQGGASAATWIYRLAVRTVLDVQRGQRRWWRRWGNGLRLNEKQRPAAANDAADRVHAAVQQLNEADRALVHLYYFEEKSLAEIEGVLGVPRDNLKMRLARARQRLKPLLEEPDAHG